MHESEHDVFSQISADKSAYILCNIQLFRDNQREHRAFVFLNAFAMDL
jgi:hypothetical protein